VTTRLVTATGEVVCGARWDAPIDPVDARVLDRVVGPALDAGCGPGRVTRALAERGIAALGIDITPSMIGKARARGAIVLRRSVFDRVPGAGRWGSVIALDGNLGIGGDPRRMLARCHELLAPGGRLLAEVSATPPAVVATERVALVVGERAGPAFAWCDVTLADTVGHGRACGFQLHDQWEDGGRCFVELRR
jgi:SAM-dependent methyltransferase